MKAANEHEKADSSDLWDTNKLEDITKFLYLEGIGKTGEDLIKKTKVQEGPDNTDSPSEENKS